jgi:hypothetical protein
MPVSLPPRHEEKGAVVRLLLAEARDPGQEREYQEDDSKIAMQWMKRVLQNRLENRPAQFLAPHARTLVDIMKARGQFEGFSTYPNYKDTIADRLQTIIDIANAARDRRSAAYIRFVQNALDVAAAPAIPDPSRAENPGNNLICAWRSKNARVQSPGSRFVLFRERGGNNFFTLLP